MNFYFHRIFSRIRIWALSSDPLTLRGRLEGAPPNSPFSLSSCCCKALTQLHITAAAAAATTSSLLPSFFYIMTSWALARAGVYDGGEVRTFPHRYACDRDVTLVWSWRHRWCAGAAAIEINFQRIWKNWKSFTFSDTKDNKSEKRRNQNSWNLNMRACLRVMVARYGLYRHIHVCNYQS